MKWWLKLGLALILAAAIAFLGISGLLGYSMTKAKRVPIEENPARLGLEYEEYMNKVTAFFDGVLR